jgi:putative CocE/NonD family hydrolase
LGNKHVTRRDFMRHTTGAARAALVANTLQLGLPQLGSPSRAEGSDQPMNDSTVWFLKKDLAWVARLSQPEHEVRFEFDVKIPMRDGIKLSANIWRPKAKGRFPIIYMHTMYDKSNRAFHINRAKYFVPRGYAFVAVDVRGMFDSDGVGYFFWHPNWRKGRFDGQDVDDCLTWLGEQPWSIGKIGMTGPSGLAFEQWMAAPLGNSHLTTIIPYVSPDDHYDNVYQNAAFQLANNMRAIIHLGGSRVNNRDLDTDFFDWETLVRHLPLRTMDEAMLGKKSQVWQDFIDHPDNDSYWRFSVGDRPRSGEMGPGKYAQVSVPTLNITGWFDEVQQATINNYLGMVRYGPETLRHQHRLIVGPWKHAVGEHVVGDLDFGLGANAESMPADLGWHSYWLKPVELRWYDYWLKNINNGIMDEAPVHIFVMGENKWRRESQWPLDRTREMKYYLRGSGRANSRFGDGKLSTNPPAEEPSDSFVYDPNDPVITYGGIEAWQGLGTPNIDGPRDQRSIQRRKDVLVYGSEPLQKDVEVTGRILCKLFAASTATDTDFTAKLVDVYPDGYAQLLRDGVIRARYRDSFKKQELINPGKVYEYTVDLWSTSHIFRKGHMIQVEISSSNFPKFDRNPNTGNRFGEDAELRTATQTIYHNHRYPSHIILPVAPREA